MSRKPILGLAALSLIAVPVGGVAQSNSGPPLRTPETISACLTLDRIADDLDKQVKRDKSWIRENRNRNSVSTDYFNRRVAESNGRVQFLNKLSADYKSNCTNGVLTNLLRDACTRQQAQMNKFIYFSPRCVRFRAEQ